MTRRVERELLGVRASRAPTHNPTREPEGKAGSHFWNAWWCTFGDDDPRALAALGACEVVDFIGRKALHRSDCRSASCPGCVAGVAGRSLSAAHQIPVPVDTLAVGTTYTPFWGVCRSADERDQFCDSVRAFHRALVSLGVVWGGWPRFEVLPRYDLGFTDIPCLYRRQAFQPSVLASWQKQKARGLLHPLVEQKVRRCSDLGHCSMCRGTGYMPCGFVHCHAVMFTQRIWFGHRPPREELPLLLVQLQAAETPDQLDRLQRAVAVVRKAIDEDWACPAVNGGGAWAMAEEQGLGRVRFDILRGPEDFVSYVGKGIRNYVAKGVSEKEDLVLRFEDAQFQAGFFSGKRLGTPFGRAFGYKVQRKDASRRHEPTRSFGERDILVGADKHDHYRRLAESAAIEGAPLVVVGIEGKSVWPTWEPGGFVPLPQADVCLQAQAPGAFEECDESLTVTQIKWRYNPYNLCPVGWTNRDMSNCKTAVLLTKSETPFCNNGRFYRREGGRCPADFEPCEVPPGVDQGEFRCADGLRGPFRLPLPPACLDQDVRCDAEEVPLVADPWHQCWRDADENDKWCGLSRRTCEDEGRGRAADRSQLRVADCDAPPVPFPCGVPGPWRDGLWSPFGACGTHYSVGGKGPARRSTRGPRRRQQPVAEKTSVLAQESPPGSPPGATPAGLDDRAVSASRAARAPLTAAGGQAPERRPANESAERQGAGPKLPAFTTPPSVEHIGVVADTRDCAGQIFLSSRPNWVRRWGTSDEVGFSATPRRAVGEPAPVAPGGPGGAPPPVSQGGVPPGPWGPLLSAAPKVSWCQPWVRAHGDWLVFGDGSRVLSTLHGNPALPGKSPARQKRLWWLVKRKLFYAAQKAAQRVLVNARRCTLNRKGEDKDARLLAGWEELLDVLVDDVPVRLLGDLDQEHYWQEVAFWDTHMPTRTASRDEVLRWSWDMAVRLTWSLVPRGSPPGGG